MRKMLVAISAALLAGVTHAAAPAADPGCRAITGWDQVLARAALHWIVIGELHGTAETPAIFADAVCLTARARGPLVVALEMPTIDQARIDAYISSDGGDEAKAQFLQAAIWHGQMKDGRSSEAVFGLFERLRQLHATGSVSRVVAFQDTIRPDDPPGDQGPYEARMAATVREAAAPGALVMALVGNLHARKTTAGFGRTFRPMSSHLPADQALTLNAVSAGGAAWTCQADGCGAHANAELGAILPPGVVLRQVEDGAYDGVLNMGRTTASPPQPAV